MSHCAEGEKKLQLYRDGLTRTRSMPVMYRTSYDTVTSDRGRSVRYRSLPLGFLAARVRCPPSLGLRCAMDEERHAKRSDVAEGKPWAMYHGKQLEQAYHGYAEPSA